jgi:hypothetical protein
MSTRYFTLTIDAPDDKEDDYELTEGFEALAESVMTTAHGTVKIAIAEDRDVIFTSYSDDGPPDRIRAHCGCGYEIVWTDDGWQHDAAPYLWGNDHEPDNPEPDPTDPRRLYWEREDGYTDASRS